MPLVKPAGSPPQPIHDMSNWLILPQGSVAQPLADAWSDKTTDQHTWVKTTAEAIEAFGNQNPSNSGYIILKEEPGEDGLSAILFLQSIDWQAHEMMKNLPALQRIKVDDPRKFSELKNLGDRTVRAALTATLHQQILLFTEQISMVPTYRLANMSDQDLDVIDALLAIAEEETPPHISYMQLHVEDRLDFILGDDNEQLIAFHKLPLKKQIEARRNIVEVFGWQQLYPGLCAD